EPPPQSSQISRAPHQRMDRQAVPKRISPADVLGIVATGAGGGSSTDGYQRPHELGASNPGLHDRPAGALPARESYRQRDRPYPQRLPPHCPRQLGSQGKAPHLARPRLYLSSVSGGIVTPCRVTPSSGFVRGRLTNQSDKDISHPLPFPAQLASSHSAAAGP